MSYTLIVACACNNKMTDRHEVKLLAQAGQRRAILACYTDHPGGEVILDGEGARRIGEALVEWSKSYPANLDVRETL